MLQSPSVTQMATQSILSSSTVLIASLFSLIFHPSFSHETITISPYQCSDINTQFQFQSAKNFSKQLLMDSIEHRTLKINGINIHLAEIGSADGPVVLFVHGFPELWYSWRHQIVALAAQGYRAVAPDLRGFGDSDAPEDRRSYTCFHIVGDLVGIIDAVAPEQQVFVVGHDWGAYMAWMLCLLRPERIKALVNLSVAFPPRNPTVRITTALRAVYGDDYYICRIQKPGDIEAEFAELGTERVMKEFLSYRYPGPLFFPKGKVFYRSPENPLVLPGWLSEEDVRYYTEKFEKTGFTGGLNYYRNLDLNWELLALWTGAKVKVPTKFIVGDQDLTYNSLGAKDYIEKGGLKNDVPFLQEVVVMEGVAHFLTQEKPDEISKHIYDFIKKF